MGGAVTVLTLALLAWRLGRMAVLHVTFSLPFLSTRPRVMALALVPGTLAAVALTYLRRSVR